MQQQGPYVENAVQDKHRNHVSRVKPCRGICSSNPEEHAIAYSNCEENALAYSNPEEHAFAYSIALAYSNRGESYFSYDTGYIH